MKKTAIRLGKRLLAFSIVAVLVALTACGGGAAPPASSATPVASKPPVASAPATSAAPVSTAKVVVVRPALTGPPRLAPGETSFIKMPKDGATLEVNTLYVMFTLENMHIMPASSTNVQGHGHINFYLDVDPIPIEQGKPAILPSPLPTGYTGKIYRGWDDKVASEAAYIWRGVPNGVHTFGAQAVQNDDTPFNPPIWGKVTVTLKGEFPGGTPTVAPAKTKAVTQKATITSFTPTSGGAGTSVTITGTILDEVMQVMFGDISAASFKKTATQIIAVVGSGATGKITVMTPNGITISNDTFTFK